MKKRADTGRLQRALACCLLMGCGTATQPAAPEVGGEVASDLPQEQRRVEPGDTALPGELDFLSEGVRRADDVVDGEPAERPLLIPPPYPLDGSLRLNQIQVKGTHNSYHLIPDEVAYPDWNYQHEPLDVQLEELGVRQVELDVHWDPATSSFLVFHVPILDPNSSCHTFVECLTILRDWSDRTPGHHLLFVLVEPKDDIDPVPITGHYLDLEEEILSVWPRPRLLTPDDVRGESPSLRQAIAERGWPTLGQGRDKALFLMLDSSEHQKAYIGADPSLSGRVLFVRGDPDDEWGIFVERGNPKASFEEIKALVQSGHIVRTAADDTAPDKREGNPATAEAARTSGAHLISTDFPAPGPGYWFDLPGGNPSRCNPQTAPLDCTAADVEQPPLSRN